MSVINLTPHDITVGNKTYPASGVIARVEQESMYAGTVDGFSVVRYSMTGHNLPEPEWGTYLLVSAMVLAIANGLGRTDCIAPDTNNATRNDKGHIISVPGFVA